MFLYTAVDIIKKEFPFVEFSYTSSGYLYVQDSYSIFVNSNFVKLSNYNIGYQIDNIPGLVNAISFFFPKEFYLSHKRDKKINNILDV